MDTLPPLSNDKIKQGKEVVDMLLCSSWAVDSMMAVALSFTVACKLCVAKDVLVACKQLLDYAATNTNATIWYLASDMTLAVHSDVLYLSKCNSKSRDMGHYNFTKSNNETFDNQVMLILSTIMMLHQHQRQNMLPSFIANKLSHFM